MYTIGIYKNYHKKLLSLSKLMFHLKLQIQEITTYSYIIMLSVNYHIETVKTYQIDDHRFFIYRNI